MNLLLFRDVLKTEKLLHPRDKSNSLGRHPH